MPTVLRIGPYRFFFYSNEKNEPAHIHIQRDHMLAKFWLNRVALANSMRFTSTAFKKARGISNSKQKTSNEAWNEYFSN